MIFALTLVVSVLLLWAYFRRFYGVFLPMSGALVNVIWGLGFAAWVGYNLDPLVLVVPMLLTARAISHSVQFVERFYEEYEALGDKDEACIRSMAELLLPGTLGDPDRRASACSRSGWRRSRSCRSSGSCARSGRRRSW